MASAVVSAEVANTDRKCNPASIPFIYAGSTEKSGMHFPCGIAAWLRLGYKDAIVGNDCRYLMLEKGVMVDTGVVLFVKKVVLTEEAFYAFCVYTDGSRAMTRISWRGAHHSQHPSDSKQYELMSVY